MLSYFEAMGMATDTPEALIQLYQRATKTAVKVPAHQGHYLKWADTEGAEVWLHISEQGELVDALPYFRGESQFAASLNQHLRDTEGSPLTGFFQGWANPTPHTFKGEFPIVFQAINIGCLSEWSLPLITELKLSGFAKQIEVFPSKESFLNHPNNRMSESQFLPSGLFHTNGRPNPNPQPEAIFSGKVLKTKSKKNALTGQNYQWALIETQGGVIDIVFAEDFEVKKDYIIMGHFWLCGLVLDPK